MLLNEYQVDIEFTLNSLKNRWRGNGNPTAFTKLKDTGSDLMMCCPFHNETKPSFGISKEYPYQYNCFSCGSGGELVGLIQHVYECNYLEALRILKRDFATYTLDLGNIFEEDEEEFHLVEDISRYTGKKHSYIRDRGISDFTLLKYEIGYDEETSSITFPVRDLDSELLFVVRRAVYNKYYNIPSNAPKGSVLYGLNYLKGKTSSCFIVEGMVDVLSCYEAKLPSVGLGGRMLSELQVKQLIKAGIKEVILFLDNDKWGVLGTVEAYKVLSKYPLVVKVVSYPERWGIDSKDCEYKDPNDLLRVGKLESLKIISYIDFYIDIKKHLRGKFK